MNRDAHAAATYRGRSQVETIRRVLRGQWANAEARLKALDALADIESELQRVHRNRATPAEAAAAREFIKHGH